MKKIMLLAISAMLLFSCKNNTEKGKFTVTGEIKSAPDQKLYLEELPFSQSNPQVLDTAQIKNGKFTISEFAQQEGLYRLRLENDNTGFIFINDKPDIKFSTDFGDISLQKTSFDSYANSLLKNFIITLDSQRNIIEAGDVKLQQLKEQKVSDSILTETSKSNDDKISAYKDYIIHYIDSVSDPVMAVFALGYSRNIDPNKLQKTVSNLTKRFPKNETISNSVGQYSLLVAQYNTSPHIGGIAPGLNFPDTSGKPFALSSLLGKYVLVDFWASWCAPCRGENPNVVKAYNQFKDKNFTVLGVSLDTSKQQWIGAIKADNLTWNHISDLQSWNSAAVNLYNFNSIPYNVLVDPQGKIIAFNLRGEELQNKLMEVLR